MTNPDQPDRVEHRMERTYEVAATPEQVWDAIATADGISAWMVPTRLDPQIGGEVSFDLGDFWSTGIVTDYTPNIDSRTKNRGRSLTRSRHPDASGSHDRRAAVEVTTTCRRSPRSLLSSSSNQRPAAVA